MFQNIQSYCKNTTVHGFKYIGEQKRHLTEKIFWGIALVFSSIGCVILITELFNKIQNNPTVDYMSESPTLISEIPFPSVSYCPEIITRVEKFNYEIIVNDLKNNKINFLNLTENELKLMQAVGLVMNDEFLLNYLINYNITIPTDDLMSYISKLNPHLRWNIQASFSKKYSVHFAKIITPWGYCNTFNNLDAEDLLNLNNTSEDFHYKKSILVNQTFIHTNEGYRTVESNESYPWSTDNSQSGFSISLQNLNKRKLKKINLATIFTHPENVYDGIHFIFHNTDEMITKLPSNQQNFYGQIEGSVLYWIKPAVKQIDDSIKSISLEERQCYLENEKTLKFFKVYSKNSCNQECISDQMLNACGCVQFYMIRSQDTKACGITDKACVAKIELDFLNQVDQCKCFPSCNNIRYKIEQQNQIILGKDSIKPLNNRNMFEKVEFNVIFKENDFLSVIRRKQFSGVEVLSFVGGLLGLFAGFSALSFVEVIYYFTIRVGFIYNQRNKVHLIKNGKFKNKDARIVKDIWKEYLAASSIHGLNASGAKNWMLKMFWFVSFCASMIACGLLIQELYIKFKDFPIVISMNAESSGVQSIPFPAITFMGTWEREENPAQDNNLTKEKVLGFETTVVVCNQVGSNEPINDTTNVVNNAIKAKKTINLTPAMGLWNNYYNTPFADMLTHRGYGYTFNMINSSDLLNVDEVSNELIYQRNLEDFKTDDKKLIKSFPWSTSAEEADGFKLTFKKYKFKDEDNLMCFENSFIVHNTDEILFNIKDEDLCQHSFSISIDVIITAEVFITDADLIKFSPEKRHCLFQGEKILRFYKIYSKKNCEMECLSNYTKKKCDCVPFYSIRDKSTRVCWSRSEYDCWTDIEFSYYSSQLNLIDDCNCLSACNSIKYNVEYIRNDLNANYDEK
ncbi:unnamed protein product [Diamesa tonsa]